MDACCVGRTVGVQPETRFSQVDLGMVEAQSPESNVVAFTRAIIDRFLKTDVLTTPKKIESTEWGFRIRRFEQECANHLPGACQTKAVGLRPAGKLKGGVKLLQRACQHKIDRVAGQSVPGNCKARHTFAQENFKAHANDARQDNVGRYSVSNGQSQHRWQSLICDPKDKNDQPDSEDAQP